MPLACEVTTRGAHGSAEWSGSNCPPPWASWTESTPPTSASANAGMPAALTIPVMGSPAFAGR